MGMMVMGIDSSSQKTGIALYDSSLIHYDLIDLSHIRDYDERFPEMTKRIQDKIMEYRPALVYAEDTWEKLGMFNNTATVKKLSYLIGAIRYLCFQHRIPFNLIYPSEWRKVVGLKTGKMKREELKRLSIDYVARHFNVEVNDDVADAICIAEAGYIINNDLFG